MRKDTCIHFSGIQNERCEKNIDYLDITGGNRNGFALRLPCIKGKPEARQCYGYTEPTEEQINDYQEKCRKQLEDMQKVYPLIGKIKKEFEGKSWRGTKECPVCTGTLHLTHASINGHVWGKCETEGCVSWME